ncbi:acetyl-CoA sensor PanZ family protein, partial [Pseudomonas aeruginosa]|uniref:acetyl-CoA sensor PanZ family protein n=1 Tax=Pseudomonas aeruginosa TaxID=287 RepID=UPI0034E088EB
MPVIVETLAQPSAQDRLDLAKIYADAPDWLFAPHADGAALVAAGLAAGELIAGRFNDRLLGAALLRRGGDAWQLSHLCVRGITLGQAFAKAIGDKKGIR